MTTQTLLLLAVPFVLCVAGGGHVIRKCDTWDAWIYMLGLLK